MNCTLCQKEITSKITGDYCTSCYFKNKSKLNPDKNVSNQSQEALATLSLSNQSGLVPSILNPLDTSALEESIPESIPEDDEPEIQHKPSKSKNQSIEDNVKYCQSCIERGYGKVLATREWNKGEFLCDDCFTPLLNNITGLGDNEVIEIKRMLKENSPLVNPNMPLVRQFYDLFKVPEPLRFYDSDLLVSKREKIFNHHAVSNVNLTQDELLQMIEEYQISLFYIRESLNSFQDQINRIKLLERDKNQLSGLEKSEKEFKKTGTSKVKQDKDQKLADVMFRHLNSAKERMEAFREFNAATRSAEFKKITGN